MPSEIFLYTLSEYNFSIRNVCWTDIFCWCKRNVLSSKLIFQLRFRIKIHFKRQSSLLLEITHISYTYTTATMFELWIGFSVIVNSFRGENSRVVICMFSNWITISSWFSGINPFYSKANSSGSVFQKCTKKRENYRYLLFYTYDQNGSSARA